MRTRRRGHSLRLDGPGRVRIKLAEIIKKSLGCECDPNDIWTNNYPAAKWLDLARWGVTCRFEDKAFRNVHSWDTMTDIVKNGLSVVFTDSVSCEVCIAGEWRDNRVYISPVSPDSPTLFPQDRTQDTPCQPRL